MRAIQVATSSYSLFPPIKTKFKPLESPARIKDLKNNREPLPSIKINHMNSATNAASSLKKYKKIKYLGKGSYGAALLVCLRSNPTQKFVIKEIVIGHLRPSEQQAAKTEADVLHQMAHSNITMYIESFVENAKLYIVMEFADGGDLCGAVKNRRESGKKWAEAEVMRIFVQICLALKHVHEANILHRDLKSQNIFLTLKGVVKLGDFGIAKMLDASADKASTTIGTPYYLSPEICESLPYGQKSDVWSLGVVLFEICALELPFQAKSLPSLVQKICHAEPPYAKIESHFSASLVSLMKRLLSKAPEERPSVKEILRTSYVKSHICELLSYTLVTHSGGGEGALNLRRSNSSSPLPLHTPVIPATPHKGKNTKESVSSAAAYTPEADAINDQSKGFSSEDSPGKLEDEYLRLMELDKQSDIRRELARQESERELQRKLAREQAEQAEALRKEKLRRFKLEMLRKKESEEAQWTNGVIVVDSASPPRVAPAPTAEPSSENQSKVAPHVAYGNARQAELSSETPFEFDHLDHDREQQKSESMIEKPMTSSSNATKLDSDNNLRAEGSVDSAVNEADFAHSDPSTISNLKGGTQDSEHSTRSLNQDRNEYDITVVISAMKNQNHRGSSETALVQCDESFTQSDQAPNSIGLESDLVSPIIQPHVRGEDVRSRDMSPESRVAHLRSERERRRDDELIERDRVLKVAIKSNIHARENLDQKLRAEGHNGVSPSRADKVDESIQTPVESFRRAPVAFTIDIEDNAEAKRKPRLSPLSRSPPKRPLPPPSVRLIDQKPTAASRKAPSGGHKKGSQVQDPLSIPSSAPLHQTPATNNEGERRSGWGQPTDLSGIMTHVQYRLAQPVVESKMKVDTERPSVSETPSINTNSAENPFAQLIDDNVDAEVYTVETEKLVSTLRARSEKQREAQQAAAEAFQARRAKRMQLLRSNSSPVSVSKPVTPVEASIEDHGISAHNLAPICEPTNQHTVAVSDGEISRKGSHSSVTSVVNSKRLADVLDAVASAVQAVNLVVESRASPLPLRVASSSYVSSVASSCVREKENLSSEVAPSIKSGEVSSVLDDKENDKGSALVENIEDASAMSSGADILEKTLDLWFSQSSHSLAKAAHVTDIQTKTASKVQPKSVLVHSKHPARYQKPTQAIQASASARQVALSPTPSKSPIARSASNFSRPRATASAAKAIKTSSRYNYSQDGRRIPASSLAKQYANTDANFTPAVVESVMTMEPSPMILKSEAESEEGAGDGMQDTPGDISTMQCFLASELMAEEISPTTL